MNLEGQDTRGRLEMSTAFDDILNDCLERMAAGEDLGRCVRRYPEHAAELEPLLATAAATHRAAGAVVSRPGARAAGLARLNRAIEERGMDSGLRRNDGGARRRSRFPFLSWPLGRPAILGFALVLLFAVAAGGTTMASEDAVPGDPLYWVKTTRETITLRMSNSDMARAHTHARLAGERGAEIHKLMLTGRTGEAENLIERFDRHLEECASLAGVTLPDVHAEMPHSYALVRTTSIVEIRTSLEHDGVVIRERMLQVWSEAPPNQKPMVQHMLWRLLLRYQLFIRALEDDAPTGRPFWVVHSAGSR